MASPARIPVERRVAALCGVITVFVAIAGLLGIAWGNTTLASLAPGYKTISLFAAAAWIVLGGVLCFHAIRPLAGAARTLAAAACAAVSLACAIEVPVNLLGLHSTAEEAAVRTGDLITGQPTTHVSPLAAILCIVLAIVVFVLLYATGDRKDHETARSAVGLTGAGVFTVGFTVLISYLYGSPLLYGTTIAPTSYTSALAACIMGIGVLAAAGPDAYPLRHFYGTSTRALILRTFLPLTLVIIFIQDLFILRLEHIYGINDTLLLAVSLVLFCILSLLIVAFTSQKLGDLVDRAEEEVRRKNNALNAAYEQLTASDEELRENYGELAKSQDALRESNRRLTEAQELAHLGFWSWDVRSGQVTWSDEVFKIFGLDPATFTPQIDSILALSPWPEEQQRGRELIQRATASHVPGTYEQRFLRSDKSEGYYHSTFEGRYDNAGNLTAIVGTVLDITERKKTENVLRAKHTELNAAYEQLTATEEELRQNYEELAKSEQNLRASERRLRRFYDAGLIGVIQWNTAGKITDANDKYLSMTGYSRDDLLTGRIDWSAMTPPEFHAMDNQALAELKETGFNREPYEKENLKKDGTRLPILVAAAMLDDRFSEGVAFILDNSARKQAEAERETFAQQRELALRAAHLGWWHYDPVTKISTYDTRYTEIFGVTGNSSPNEELLALLHPDDLSRVLAAVDAALNPADPHPYAIEYRVNAKDGVMRWIRATGLATFSGEGTLRHATSFVGTVEDISARKIEERALRLANQKLHLMNVVAWHDIQNKVTGLRGYIELSRDLVADENVKKMFRAEESILKVIHQQLEYTREYQKIGEKPSEWVDIRTMLSIVLALKSIRSVRVEINVDGLFVYTDPILEKVFLHLIENTLVHAKTATEIRIGYRETPGDLVLVYEDNGPGIPQAEKETLFVRTFATTHFGLFFIHDLLEIAGIGFTETGEPGKGVRFEMAIPRGMYRIGPQPGPGA